MNTGSSPMLDCASWFSSIISINWCFAAGKFKIPTDNRELLVLFDHVFQILRAVAGLRHFAADLKFILVRVAQEKRVHNFYEQILDPNHV